MTKKKKIKIGVIGFAISATSLLTCMILSLLVMMDYLTMNDTFWSVIIALVIVSFVGFVLLAYALIKEVKTIYKERKR